MVNERLPILQTLVFIRREQIIAKSADAADKPLPTAQHVLNSDISLYIAPCKHVSKITVSLSFLIEEK